MDTYEKSHLKTNYFSCQFLCAILGILYVAVLSTKQASGMVVVVVNDIINQSMD